MVLFIFTLGTSLAGRLSTGTAAPMLAAAPSGFGGGPPVAATMAPANPAPATNVPANPASATEASASPRTANQAELATPTEQALVMSVPEATLPAETHAIQSPPTQKALKKQSNPWLFIWPGLGVLLGALALIVRWLNQRAFQRKNSHG
jgi:hypothetical protein